MIFIRKHMRRPGRKMSYQYIHQRIGHYGFTEISDILNLKCIASEASLLYIKERLTTCLNNHDRGEDWFIPLRQLLQEIEGF